MRSKRGFDAENSYLNIIFIQEKDDSNIVMESHNVGFGEGFDRGHIGLGGLQGPQNVLG